MLKGSCLCGKVQYKLNQEISTIIFCHCSYCRKETGSAFNTASTIQRKNIQITAGEDQLKKFSQGGVNRHFCSNCGSKLFTSRDDDPAGYRLRIGTLDSEINPEHKIHIFTASKANWDQINDEHPQFQAMLQS